MKNKISLYVIAVSLVITCAISLASCNVTRTVTTTSSAFQRGDTAVSIVTKTVESYDATKR